MELKECMKNIQNYLEHNNEFTLEELEIIKAGFNFLCFHIYILDKTEVSDINDGDVVKKSLRILSRKLLNDSLSNSLALVLISFVDIIYNWNNNFKKDEDIELFCKYIYIVCSMRDSLRYALATSRMVYTHYKDLKNWMPPAFDINKAYLEKLLDTNKKLTDCSPREIVNKNCDSNKSA